MPVITRFYGIIIKMFFSDHAPSHFHAIYQEYNAVYNLETLEMTEGDMPPRANKMIEEWAKEYQKILIEMWKSQEIKKLPELK